jgi:hypothetical protein
MNSALVHPTNSPVARHIADWFHQGLDGVRALLTHAASDASASHPRSVFEEAEQARAIADNMMRSDPRTAQDLYAAADRHERQAAHH